MMQGVGRRLVKVNVWIGQDQLDVLQERAKRKRGPYAPVLREALDLGLARLEKIDQAVEAVA